MKWQWEVLRDGKVYTYSEVGDIGIFNVYLGGSTFTKKGAHRQARRHVRKKARREEYLMIRDRNHASTVEFFSNGDIKMTED